MTKLKELIRKTRVQILLKLRIRTLNKRLNLDLSLWQIDYIFNNGPYRSEEGYGGRAIGRTTATVLKALVNNRIARINCSTGAIYDSNNRYAIGVRIEDDRNKRRQIEWCRMYRKYSKALTARDLKILGIKLPKFE